MGLPSGFIPQEDQGMIYAVIETPPGATIERTNEVAQQLLKIAEKEEGAKSVSSLAGSKFLSEGTSANSGSCLINLKDWKHRKRTAKQIIETWKRSANASRKLISTSSNRPRCPATVRPVDSNCVCWTRPATTITTKWSA